MKYRKGHFIIGIMLLVVTCFMQVTPALATEQEPWKTVRVSCGINKALYLNENGEPEGYCSEYLTDLADINHWNLEYVEGSWSESVQNLYDGKIDLLFPTQETEERKSTMGFSTAIGGYQPIGLFANSNSDLCYDDYEAFDGAKVALSKGTSNEAVMEAYAKENGFTFEAIDMNTTEEKREALKDGTVDMIVFSTLNDVPEGKVVAMLDYLPFYYCTRIEDQELLQEVNYGMNQMLIRHSDVTENVFYSFMNGNVSFAYTRDEQNAIKENGNIIIGIYKDTDPLFNIDQDGNYFGIYVDLIERIREISGLNIEIRALDRKEIAFEYLNKGDLDFVMGSSDQSLMFSDEKGYEESEGIMDYYSIYITRSNFLLSDSNDMRIVLTNGRKYWEPKLRDEYPTATFSYVQSSKECLNAVQEKKADMTILNSWEYNYQSKNKRFENLMEWENTRTLSQTVFISRKGENALLRSVLNKSIEQISNAEKEGIITANLNHTYMTNELADYWYGMKHAVQLFLTAFFILIAGFAVYIIMRSKTMKTLEIKNKQLENANDAKDRFLSRMSHELRTPLNAINGYATVMNQEIERHESSDEKNHQYIESILRAAKYQLALIGDLLDIQKIETGKMVMAPTEIDSEYFMKDIVEMIQPEAEEKGIEFTYERLSVVNDSYLIDEMRFQQVLLNILHNAIKFTPAGGHVKMTAEVIDKGDRTNTLKFVISDDGIGMSEDFQQNYLFHQFAQEYEGNTSPFEGCGTGLAISKEIMHLLGGEITCDSKKGEGSTFTIILTANHLDKKHKSRERRPKTSYNLSGVRVLLVEDNQMNQDMEKRLLQKMQCEVEIADDGQIALDKYTQSEKDYYSIIFMDIRMPNMDGLEATAAIRALSREDARNIPILALSANAFEEDVQKSLEVGINEHLSKPVDAKILYDKIKEYCNV